MIALQQDLPAAAGAHEAVPKVVEAGGIVTRAGKYRDSGNQGYQLHWTLQPSHPREKNHV